MTQVLDSIGDGSHLLFVKRFGTKCVCLWTHYLFPLSF